SDLKRRNPRICWPSSSDQNRWRRVVSHRTVQVRGKSPGASWFLDGLGLFEPSRQQTDECNGLQRLFWRVLHQLVGTRMRDRLASPPTERQGSRALSPPAECSGGVPNRGE